MQTDMIINDNKRNRKGRCTATATPPGANAEEIRSDEVKQRFELELEPKTVQYDKWSLSYNDGNAERKCRKELDNNETDLNYDLSCKTT